MLIARRADSAHESKVRVEEGDVESVVDDLSEWVVEGVERADVGDAQATRETEAVKCEAFVEVEELGRDGPDFDDLEDAIVGATKIELVEAREIRATKRVGVHARAIRF